SIDAPPVDERLRSLAGPAARNLVSWKTVKLARSSATLGSPALASAGDRDLQLRPARCSAGRQSATSTLLITLFRSSLDSHMAALIERCGSKSGPSRKIDSESSWSTFKVTGKSPK